jgi:hypothetical protein
MKRRGSLYFIVLIFLVVASMTAWLWQMHLAEISQSISNTWNHHLAEQNAFSGIEYVLALRDQGALPQSPFTISLPVGTCMIRYRIEDRILKIEATGMVGQKRGHIVSVRSHEVRIPPAE